jgi:surface carbohydrate biosynthesis protein
MTKFKKICKLLKALILSKKILRRPKNCDILIYDITFPNILLDYFKNYSLEVLPTRGESLNLYILLKSVFKKEFWECGILWSYTVTYIAECNPKIIVTFIDNNQKFYSLSSKFKDIKTIFIQNGTRGMSGDIFEYLTREEDFFVDFMCVQNREIGEKYKKFIKGEIIIIGSLINNSFPMDLTCFPNRVVFISQFTPKKNKSDIYYSQKDGTLVFWKDFYNAEVNFLKLLQEWCVLHKKELVICGRYPSGSSEKEFFSEILKDFHFEFVPRSEIFSSYKVISTAEIVITIDSTIGFEALAQGKRVAFFSVRHTKGAVQYQFGWPANLPTRGPFWSNNLAEDSFSDILNFLDSIPKDMWLEIVESYKPILMEFDLGNKKLTSLLKNILIQ